MTQATQWCGQEAARGCGRGQDLWGAWNVLTWWKRCFVFFFSFLAALGFEPGASRLPGGRSIT